MAGLCAASVGAQTSKPAGKKPAAAAHVILTPGDMKWGPAPAVLPAGAQWLCWTAIVQARLLHAPPEVPGRLQIPAHASHRRTSSSCQHVQGRDGRAFSESGLHEFRRDRSEDAEADASLRVAKGEVVVQIYGTARSW
jgi:hypothetical protein